MVNNGKTKKKILVGLFRTVLYLVSGALIEVGTSNLIATGLSLPYGTIISVSIITVCFIILWIINIFKKPIFSYDNDASPILMVLGIIISATMDNYFGGLLTEFFDKGIIINVILILMGAALIFIDMKFVDGLYERIREPFNGEKFNKNLIRGYGAVFILAPVFTIAAILIIVYAYLPAAIAMI